MELVLSCAWLAVLVWLIFRAFRQRGLLQIVEPAAAPSPERAPGVAVVVPMRDEASNIGACLDGLVRQDYPRARLRIVAVDDHSADQTAAIVAGIANTHPQIALLRSPPLPANWIGKSHACWIGARAADPETDWLCFIDADVKSEPALLSSALQRALSEKVDLLSLAPRQDLHSFAERLIMPCGLFLLAFRQDLARLQARDGHDATATGQFMLVRRGAYEAVGGHPAVRSAICEDLELARLIKRSGGNVVLRGGERLLSTRMYTGWRTLWPGLAKNIVDLLGGKLATLTTALAAVTLAWAAVLIPALAAIGCAHGSAQACLATALAACGSGAALALHIAGTRYFRIPLWYGLIFPLGYTAGALIALDSLRRRLRGRVSWKGRTYP